MLADEMMQEASAWADRHAYGRDATPRPLGPAREAPFQAMALLRLDPDIGLTSCYRPAARDVPTPLQNVLRGGAILLRPSSGLMVVQQQDLRVVVTTREAVLLTPTHAPTIRLVGVERLDWFEIVEGDLSAPMVGAASSLRVFEEDNAALSLLGSYGAALMRGLLPLATETLRDHAIRHMAGLVGIMCSDAALLPRSVGSDRHARRVRAIKAEIEVRLGERGLTARHVAQFSGLSVRSLQKLFEAEGQTVSEFILERRLERALRLLRSPAKQHHSISAIAFEVGFGDLSYFNRTFRKRYGMPPRQARASDDASAARSGMGPV